MEPVVKLPKERPDFHVYALRQAALVSYRSRDTSSKVGCVVIEPKSRAFLVQGYNGFPLGIDDSKTERYERPKKYDFFAHAEQNAIAFAARNGVPLNGAIIYITAMPCCDCARLIIQSGIKEVYIPEVCLLEPRLNTESTLMMFEEAGIKLTRLPKVGAETFASGQIHLI